MLRRIPKESFAKDPVRDAVKNPLNFSNPIREKRAEMFKHIAKAK